MHDYERTLASGHWAVTLHSPELSFTVFPELAMLGWSLVCDGLEFLATPSTAAQYATGGPATGLSLAFPGGRGFTLGNLAAHRVQLPENAWSVECRADEHGAFVGADLDLAVHPWIHERFPYEGVVRVWVWLRNSMLELRVAIDNYGTEPIPMDWSWAPLLAIREVPSQEWRVSIPPNENDPRDARKTLTGFALGDAPIDRFGRMSPGSAITLAGGGHELVLTPEGGFTHLRVSANQGGPPLHLELCTAAGTDPDQVQWARPGGRFTAAFTLEVNAV